MESSFALVAAMLQSFFCQASCHAYITMRRLTNLHSAVRAGKTLSQPVLAFLGIFPSIRRYLFLIPHSTHSEIIFLGKQKGEGVADPTKVSVVAFVHQACINTSQCICSAVRKQFLGRTIGGVRSAGNLIKCHVVITTIWMLSARRASYKSGLYIRQRSKVQISSSRSIWGVSYQ